MGSANGRHFYPNTFFKKETPKSVKNPENNRDFFLWGQNGQIFGVKDPFY